MVRQGYRGEYIAKRKLIETYGVENVIKTACNRGIPDYIILKPLMGVEIKSSKRNKIYIKPREVKQWRATHQWMKIKRAPIDYWLITHNEKGRNIEIIPHAEFGSKYIEPYIRKHGEPK